jgi:hypothetical protein
MKELEDWAMRHPRVSAPFPGPKAREIHLTSALTTLIAVEEVVRHGFEHEETLEYTTGSRRFIAVKVIRRCSLTMRSQASAAKANHRSRAGQGKKIDKGFPN